MIFSPNLPNEKQMPSGVCCSCIRRATAHIQMCMLSTQVFQFVFAKQPIEDRLFQITHREQGVRGFHGCSQEFFFKKTHHFPSSHLRVTQICCPASSGQYDKNLIQYNFCLRLQVFMYTTRCKCFNSSLREIESFKNPFSE